MDPLSVVSSCKLVVIHSKSWYAIQHVRQSFARHSWMFPSKEAFTKSHRRGIIDLRLICEWFANGLRPTPCSIFPGPNQAWDSRIAPICTWWRIYSAAISCKFAISSQISRKSDFNFCIALTRSPSLTTTREIRTQVTNVLHSGSNVSQIDRGPLLVHHGGHAKLGDTGAQIHVDKLSKLPKRVVSMQVRCDAVASHFHYLRQLYDFTRMLGILPSVYTMNWWQRFQDCSRLEEIQNFKLFLSWPFFSVNLALCRTILKWLWVAYDPSRVIYEEYRY